MGAWLAFAQRSLHYIDVGPYRCWTPHLSPSLGPHAMEYLTDCLSAGLPPATAQKRQLSQASWRQPCLLGFPFVLAGEAPAAA